MQFLVFRVRPLCRSGSVCTRGRALAQLVSCRAVTEETLVNNLASPCDICGGQSGTRTGFSPLSLLQSSSVSISPPKPHTQPTLCCSWWLTASLNDTRFAVGTLSPASGLWQLSFWPALHSSSYVVVPHLCRIRNLVWLG
jgi:hypothetical protein